MRVTVLYPEERQIPDDGLESQIFGPEVGVPRREAKTLADLDPADCAEVDGLMIMRYAVLAEDIPRLRAIVRIGVGCDKISRPAAAARPGDAGHAGSPPERPVRAGRPGA